MRVMVPLQGPSLEAPVDPRFGRAPFYAILDSENPDAPEIFPNPFVFYPSSAGIAAAQMAIQKGVQAVVAPAVGPNASMVLLSAGVKILPPAGFTGKDVLKSLNQGVMTREIFPGEENLLRTQISALEAQLNQLKRRLEELEKKKEET